MSDNNASTGIVRYRDPFLEHRKAQERKHAETVSDVADPMSSLITVELNITELCNRVCVFCPRVDPDIYPNRNLNMSIEIAERVASELQRLDLKGRISFSGFGEPLLHKQFPEIVRVFRTRLPDNTIEVNTNGDRLTVAKIRELFDAGLTHLYINLYDGPEQIPHFENMVKEAGLEETQWRLRPHWPNQDEDFGLTLNNRSGMVNAPEIGLVPLDQALSMRCHYPFYKMLVDWNGDVLFCSNDWGREIVIGNVMKTSLRDLWLSEKMFAVRRHLMNGERCFSPCDKCNVHGTLHGGFSFERLIDHYVAEGRLKREEIRS